MASSKALQASDPRRRSTKAPGKVALRRRSLQSDLHERLPDCLSRVPARNFRGAPSGNSVFGTPSRDTFLGRLPEQLCRAFFKRPCGPTLGLLRGVRSGVPSWSAFAEVLQKRCRRALLCGAFAERLCTAPLRNGVLKRLPGTLSRKNFAERVPRAPNFLERLRPGALFLGAIVKGPC